jgi:hypothetical protein
MAGTTRYERVAAREDDGDSIAVEMGDMNSPAASAAAGAGGITVTLRGVGVDERRVVVASTCTVAQLKTQAYGEAQRQGHRVRFIHFGKILRDQDTLEQAGVRHGAFLHVALGPKQSNQTAIRVDDGAPNPQDDDDDEEHTEESDRQFAMRLAQEASNNDLDGAQHVHIQERFMHIPEGTSRDFVWGFLMGKLHTVQNIIFDF